MTKFKVGLFATFVFPVDVTLEAPDTNAACDRAAGDVLEEATKTGLTFMGYTCRGPDLIEAHTCEQVEDTPTLTLPSRTVTRAVKDREVLGVVGALAQNGVWFLVEPLPDGIYSVTVKDEAHPVAILRELLG